MAESVDCSDFCRLCLVKEQVNTPIFEELGDLQQIYIKITACLPIKVSLEDPLPKRICDECSYKLDQQYNFWNTSINAEKQLRQWLGLPEEPPTKSENVSGKIKREKDNYESPSKRPRRNARRKAAQHVRQAAAAAIAASDSGPGEDMDLDAFTKEENDSDNDFHDNNESMEDSTYANVGLDSEEHGEAGPSGLQKGAVTSTNSGTDAGGPGNMYGNYQNIRIKQEPVDFEPIVTILELPGSHGNKSQNQLSQNTKTKSRRKRNNPKKAKKFNLEVNDSHDNVDIKKEIVDSENDSYLMEPVVNECSICFKRFAHANSLRFHMRGHTGQNAVVCDICGKQLSSKEKLKLHRRIHTGYKPYTCDVCSKGFAKKCNLTLHLRVHSGEKPYVCDVCGKSFSQRSTLVIHERYHTGQRPYICNLCHKSFVAKGVLSIHMKSCSRNSNLDFKRCSNELSYGNLNN